MVRAKKSPAVSSFTTARPDWYMAKTAVDILPPHYDPYGHGAEFVKLMSAFVITQGEHSGKRMGSVMMDWQKVAFGTVFGAMDEDGERMVSEMLLLIGKGSAKTSTAAALAVAFAVHCGKTGKNHRTDILLIGTDVRTAKLSFDTAHAGIMADPYLRKEFRVLLREMSLIHNKSGCVIRCIPPKLEAAAGRRPSLAIFDEIWLSSTVNGFDDFRDQLKRGMSNAKEPLSVYLTTAAVNEPSGFYARTLDHADNVLEGKVIDTSFYPALFRLPVRHRPDISYLDPDVWHFGMPSLGVTQSFKSFKAEVDQAHARKGEDLRLLLSQRFCLDSKDRGGSNTHNISGYWSQIPEAAIPDQIYGPAAVGIDIGGLDDLQAVTLGWRDEQGIFNFVTRQYLLQSGFEKQSQEGKSIIQSGIDCGEIELYSTPTEMDAATIKYINECIVRCYNFPLVGGDRFGRGGVSADISAQTGTKWTDAPQNFKLRSVWEQLESLPLDDNVAMAKTPVLCWNFANLVVTDEGTAGRIFHKKDQSGGQRSKIDGAVSVLDALYLLNTIGSDPAKAYNSGSLGGGVVFVDI